MLAGSREPAACRDDAEFRIVAQMARMTRAAVIDQLAQPAEMAILGRAPTRCATHALPNAIGPIANGGAESVYLLGGAIIVKPFNYPGIAS
jgi:peptide/nickel transport system permease protein